MLRKRPNPKDVGQRIREARRRAHLTQIELARRVGIRAVPMNSIELGRCLVSTPVLASIAGELKVSVDALLFGYSSALPGTRADAGRDEAGGGGASPDTVCGMGVAEPAALRGQPELVRRLETVACAFLALEDVCGVQKAATLPLSLPFEPSEERVGDLAATVRALLGIGQGVIFDYLELFENAGLRIVFLELPEAVESVAMHDAVHANAMLFVRDGMNPERQLFRMVYGLGRIYEHVRARDASRYGAAARERDGLDADRVARKFAALFLMPETAVRATVRQLGLGPEDWTYSLLLRVKHRFGVSAQALNLRLLELGLISARLQDDLRRRIEAHYAATQHAEPDSTRRVLSPNGRLGDLLLCARERHATEEVHRIAAVLKGLPGMPEDDAEGTKNAKRRGARQRGQGG